jgi:hypothetical protein
MSDREGAELRQVLEHEPSAVVLLKDREYEKLRASGVPLRSLAEGETFGHSGLTINLIRRPVAERLRIVQGDNPASGK